jgi:alpha-beta hydrolase superfamily lysophospholipase
MERRNALKAATSLLAGGGLALAAGGARADPQARRTAVRSGFPYVETAPRTSLFYTDWGDGDAAVVFVHGWPLQSLMWQYQMLHLVKAGVRVISYDQRGCGRSADPGAGYTFDHMADDLAALIDQLGL